MTARSRLVLLAAALLCLAPATWRVASRMPAFGAHPMPYGEAINHDAFAARHVTNMVTAVNFDYRGVDTLGEEFMLLCAVTGTVMLLRGKRESEDAAPIRIEGRPLVRRADATVMTCRLFGPAVLVFGIYVALHATTTPGGGFQGGAVAASGLLLLYLGEGYRGWRRLVRSHVLDACEGGGALLFALAGLAPMFVGAVFLQNVLPLGAPGKMLSGGLMLVENAGVAFAVGGGFAILFSEFLEETREEQGAVSLLPWLVAAWLFGVGLYGIVTSRHYVHLIGCLSVCQSATYVLLLAVGYRWGAGAPIFYDHPGTPAVDPVVQALVLTDIVVGATVTALLLALALQVHKTRGTLDPDRLRTMRS